MKIFISGATGFVGGQVVHELLERGHQLRLLVHKAKKEPFAGVEYIQGDVTNRADCISGVAGCDAVINLVGIIREFPGRGITFKRLHVEAAENLVAAAGENGIRRFVQMSALGSRAGAVSGYHRSKYRAEEILIASGLDWTIFRPSLIFGPKDAFVNMIADFIRRLSIVPVIGDGEYRLQPISADDVARCFAMALEMPETVTRSYNLCGPERFTYNQLIDAVARVMGRNSVLKIRNPLFMMKMLTVIMESFPFYPVTSDQITMLLEESICDGSWQKTFSFEPVRLENGIRQYLG